MTADFYENEKLEGAEEQISYREAFAKLIPYLKEHTKGLIICLILLTGGTLLSLYWPKLLRDALDINLAENDVKGLIYTVIAIGLIQLTTIIVQYIMRIKLEIIGQDVMLSLKRRVFHHILSLDVSYFDKNPVGRLMARVESDAEALRMMFTNTIVLIVGDIILITGIYSLLFYFNWKLASILFINVPIIAVMVYIFHKKTTPKFYEVRRKMAEVTALLAEFLHGMSIVQIFHSGAYARKRVDDANKSKFDDDAYVNIAVILFFNSVFFFEYVKIGLILILGPIFGISFGTIVMFIIYVWRSFEPIWRTSEQLSTFQKAIAGSKRIFALLSEEPRITEPENAVQWDGLNESVEFENVTFSYTDDDNYVLKNVSFKIEKGKRVALVGVTGGGKSTVISLLLRYYDPQQGRVLIDGKDIRTIPTFEFRSKFALVLQDIVLFPGNIETNVSLESEKVTTEEVRNACETVKADTFISKLKEQYATEVSEKGSNFSRGERQLLSFARALVVNPDLLILDEATSSVDPETERMIQESLTKLMEGRTSLIIAHRLSTILDADEILVLKQGEIIERGTHLELIQQNGYYSDLFHLQFKNNNGELADAV
ncbi:MAG: ABC transporter ATP-binding protein [Calditrichaeota bacterium]|nr:MAG: ABC transporter ATP-binding protein [Calditrichota bacterium]